MSDAQGMTGAEMQARSREKVKQVQDLMKVLQITAEIKTRITQEGFVEDIIFYIDHEKYPVAQPEAAPAGAPGAEEAAPVAEEAPVEPVQEVVEEKAPEDAA